MNLHGLSDGELLRVGIYLEDQCCLQYMEMSRTFEFTDKAMALLLRELAREESHHRERLMARWHEEGSPHLPATELWPWLQQTCPGLLELWDPDDEDPRRAIERVRSIERDSVKIHRLAAAAAREPAVRQLFNEIADEEESHGTDFGETPDGP